MKYLALTALAAPVFAASMAIAQDELPDPYEWITETYSFPSDLKRGFVSEERGELIPPSLPEANASDEEIKAFLKSSNSILSHYLKNGGLNIPKGCFIVYDPETYTLTARAPRIAQSSIRNMAKSAEDTAPKYIAASFIVVEGEAELFRSVASRASALHDHTELYGEIENAIEAGDAEIVHHHQIDIRSGEVSQLHRTAEHIQGDTREIDPQNRITFTSDTLALGESVEVNPIICPDGVTIDWNFSLNYDFETLEKRFATVTSQDGKLIKSGVQDRSQTVLTSQTTTHKDQTNLVGVWG
ncbi:MAG: hypothetical protein AAF226_09040, partial [Verrucomicrobiota bacterium]